MVISVSELLSTSVKPQKAQAPGILGEPAGDFGTLFKEAGEALSTAALSSSSWLTSDPSALKQRPSIKEFMDKSGASFEDATELVYGVIGSNNDMRDWQAIMDNSDPITAAREATAEMYGNPVKRRDDADARYIKDDELIERTDQFAVCALKDEKGIVVDKGLKLIDKNGLILRDAGRDEKSIARNAWLFGFDVNQLPGLANAAKKLQLPFQDAFLTVSSKERSLKSNG